ncbi:MAG: Cof-type HAD-IIB family hydrolase [Alicyclobacillus sp.]|nr:Cof-type HAD-IIB family hydrolase [Alicyclobacillus sp.]
MHDPSILPYKAVFLDIDGTLAKDGQLVSSARTVVERLQARGVQVALCTGRAYVHGHSVQRALGVRHMVYFNGALALADAHTVHATPLTPHTVCRALHLAAECNLPTILHTERDTFAFADMPPRFRGLLAAFDFPPVAVVPQADFLHQGVPVYQINVFMPPQEDERFLRELPECLIYRWDQEAVDLQRSDCDKSLGALALLRYWGIPPECAVHVGDGGNDVGMFRMVGCGIAMGNASDEVKRHADRVTTRVEEHGVFQALEQLGLL